MRFADLPVSPLLAQTIAAKGYEQPTPVQALILGEDARGRDLLVSARTGSGKTLAFGLAMANELLGDAQTFGRAGKPLALVVAPTRELAMQVQRELGWLYGAAGGRVRTCVGGMDPRREQRTLADGVHVVVGTPGRLCDHLERGNLDVSALRALVLDEADEMLDMGFRDELERILRDTPKERRTLLFSATIPEGIARLATRYQRDAVRLAATPPEQAHEDIEYRAHVVAPREREHAVVNTLRALEPPGALVFCATREGVHHLHSSLVERGFQAVAISGELSQTERVRALTALRDGRARVLVATDVAARGLDLPALELVIHADLPRDVQVLHHRSGRTGRAGRKGTSILLVPFRFRSSAERLLRGAKVKALWGPLPSAESIRTLDQERLAQAVAALCSDASEEDLAVARTLLAKHQAEELVSALVKRERTSLPAPEELPETTRLVTAGTARREAPRREAAHDAHHPAARPHREATTTRETRETHRRAEPRAGAAAPAHPTAAFHAPAHGAHRPVAHAGDDGVWFRLNVGRNGNADPRWLVPLLCRRGEVVKRDIGKIEIMARETRVFISAPAAARFERASRRPDRQDPGIRIEVVRPKSEHK